MPSAAEGATKQATKRSSKADALRYDYLPRLHSKNWENSISNIVKGELNSRKEKCFLQKRIKMFLKTNQNIAITPRTSFR